MILNHIRTLFKIYLRNDNIEFIHGEKCVPADADDYDCNESISKEYGDKYIGSKVLFPNADQIREVTILSRKRSTDEALQKK